MTDKAIEIAGNVKAQFVAFEVSDDDQETLITFKAKMRDVIPLRMGLAFDYMLAIKPLPEVPHE